MEKPPFEIIKKQKLSLKNLLKLSEFQAYIRCKLLIFCVLKLLKNKNANNHTKIHNTLSTCFLVFSKRISVQIKFEVLGKFNKSAKRILMLLPSFS